MAWWDQGRSGRRIVLAWLLTRLFALLVLATAERFVTGDVFYYWRKILRLGGAGLSGTLNEYPTPVVWFLWLPYATGGHRAGYLAGFLFLMLALDAGFTYALWRTAGRRHDWSVDFWLLFVPLIGPLCYLRFDMLPAVLAGGALLAARRRPWVTGALTGLGAAVKLWPALLIPAFLVPRADRVRAATGFVVVGFGLALLSLVTGGWTRLLSPLTWQSGRGLQIESIWATPVMLARALHPAGYAVAMSRYQAYEIFGPGVDVLLQASTLATLLGFVVLAGLFVRAFRKPGAGALSVGLVVLATVAVMTVTNKTLSPQYLLWLGGPMAALLLLRLDSVPAQRRTVRLLAVELLALALATHLVYPLFYDWFLGHHGAALTVLATLVTALRNLGLLAFTVQVCVLAWRFLSPTRTGT
ncbi:MAG: hypothetical protein JWP61_2973 [Friedmanniella sp.]|nr:hypothetical protein [Friedmanniella sp.]